MCLKVKGSHSGPWRKGDGPVVGAHRSDGFMAMIIVVVLRPLGRMGAGVVPLLLCR